MTETLNQIKDGWFRELTRAWPGSQDFAMTLKVEEVLYHEKSKYQEILVFKNAFWGNVLVLDGVIQCTEKDEMSYQEMLTHLAMYSHPNPKRVLVIGGGDGGVLREVAKHKSAEEIIICEIDQCVIEASKKFLGGMGKGYSDHRVTVNMMDAFVYIKELRENPVAKKFDVIIVDSTDPVGPGESLFKKEFFVNLFHLLSDNGIITTQAESHWHSLDMIAEMSKFLKAIFSQREYAYTSVPTYPTGEIGFWVLSKQTHSNKTPLRKPTPVEQKALNYYTPELHVASFALPAFAHRKIYGDSN